MKSEITITIYLGDLLNISGSRIASSGKVVMASFATGNFSNIARVL